MQEETNAQGLIVLLCACVSGIVFCSLFLFSIRHRGRALTHLDQLCLVLVSTLLFYCAAAMSSTILIIINGNLIQGGFLGAWFCQAQGFLWHFVSGILIAIQFILALDRYSHTHYNHQLKLGISLGILMGIAVVYASLGGVLLSKPQGFILSSSLLSCALNLELEDT